MKMGDWDDLFSDRDAEITASDLGKRASNLRVDLQISVDDLASRLNIDKEAIINFEENGEGSVSLLLMLVRELSSGDEISHLLTTPRFATLDEVVAYEQRRKSRQ
jgi:transcriptional regulator with XRE-family HTH domain